MKRKICAVFRHAATMVRRKIKSYLFLSVTIVLSFSLFLGYLLYTDASLYNRYKEIFALDRNFVQTGSGSYASLSLLYEKIGEIGNSACMIDFTTHSNFHTYHISDSEKNHDVGAVSSLRVHCIPDHAWGIYSGYKPATVRWLDGKKHENMTPGEGEMLMSEGIFYGLGLDQMEVPYYTLKIAEQYSSNATYMTLKVVGLLEDEVPLLAGDVEGVFDFDANPEYDPFVVVSTATLNPLVIEDAYWYCHLLCYTDSPEEVAYMIEKAGLTPHGVFSQQNEALEQIRNEKGNKAVIACALMLLLGINLYSSFTNALNDRKFEIGVKRAIGASSWSIVRQFLYESLIVMAANIFISIAVVTDVFIAYKFIIERTPDEWGNYTDWIFYISPHSAAMFAVCAVTLTVVFSLIFAYKSTRVEIVQYLKAE